MPVRGSIGSCPSFSWLIGGIEECLKELRVHCQRVKSYNLCHLYFWCKEYISYTRWKVPFLS
uniref:Putative ovule protein n=1 Tax=Solanum chacoense TaxID=4108 RepID=A0A0V0GXZ5_SOLCH